MCMLYIRGNASVQVWITKKFYYSCTPKFKTLLQTNNEEILRPWLCRTMCCCFLDLNCPLLIASIKHVFMLCKKWDKPQRLPLINSDFVPSPLCYAFCELFLYCLHFYLWMASMWPLSFDTCLHFIFLMIIIVVMWVCLNICCAGE